MCAWIVRDKYISAYCEWISQANLPAHSLVKVIPPPKESSSGMDLIISPLYILQSCTFLYQLYMKDLQYFLLFLYCIFICDYVLFMLVNCHVHLVAFVSLSLVWASDLKVFEVNFSSCLNFCVLQHHI